LPRLGGWNRLFDSWLTIVVKIRSEIAVGGRSRRSQCEHRARCATSVALRSIAALTYRLEEQKLRRDRFSCCPPEGRPEVQHLACDQAIDGQNDADVRGHARPMTEAVAATCLGDCKH